MMNTNNFKFEINLEGINYNEQRGFSMEKFTVNSEGNFGDYIVEAIMGAFGEAMKAFALTEAKIVEKPIAKIIDDFKEVNSNEPKAEAKPPVEEMTYEEKRRIEKAKEAFEICKMFKEFEKIIPDTWTNLGCGKYQYKTGTKKEDKVSIDLALTEDNIELHVHYKELGVHGYMYSDHTNVSGINPGYIHDFIDSLPIDEQSMAVVYNILDNAT